MKGARMDFIFVWQFASADACMKAMCEGTARKSAAESQLCRLPEQPHHHYVVRAVIVFDLLRQ